MLDSGALEVANETTSGGSTLNDSVRQRCGVAGAYIGKCRGREKNDNFLHTNFLHGALMLCAACGVVLCFGGRHVGSLLLRCLMTSRIGRYCKFAHPSPNHIASSERAYILTNVPNCECQSYDTMYSTLTVRYPAASIQ